VDRAVRSGRLAGVTYQYNYAYKRRPVREPEVPQLSPPDFGGGGVPRPWEALSGRTTTSTSIVHGIGGYKRRCRCWICREAKADINGRHWAKLKAEGRTPKRPSAYFRAWRQKRRGLVVEVREVWTDA
jgi:hypothetical protein